MKFLTFLVFLLGIVSCQQEEITVIPSEEQNFTYGDIIVRVVKCENVECTMLEPVCSVIVFLFDSEDDRTQDLNPIGQQVTSVEGEAVFINLPVPKVYIKINYDGVEYLESQSVPIQTISHVDVIVE